MYVPKEDKTYKYKNEMLDELVSLLGGRVAEKLICGDISTGASNDIERATEIARKMITKYGMSDNLGPVCYAESNDEVFLGRDYGHAKNLSEATATAIDKEIKDILNNAYNRTETILTEHIDKLHEVAGYLVKNEKINGETFDKIMKGTFVPQEPEKAEESDNSQPDETTEEK